MKEFSLLIDGRLTKGASTMDVINPATGKVNAAGAVPEGPSYFVRPTIVRDIPDAGS
jgi:hypothetical protein